MQPESQVELNSEWIVLSPSISFEMAKGWLTSCMEMEGDLPLEISAIPTINVAVDKESWIVQRQIVSRVILLQSVEINPRIRGGIPLLRGTRLTIAQLIGELADGRSSLEISEAFDIDAAQFKLFLEGIAIQFDRPF